MIFQLSVARTIGIVFLVIAIIVVALLVIPVSYRLDADLDEGNGAFKIRWLLRLVRFRVLFDEGAEAVLSILFFNIDFLDEDRRNRRKEKQKAKQKKKGSEPVERSLPARMINLLRFGIRMIFGILENDVLTEAQLPVRKFLYRCRPRDVHGCVEFGMSDPSQTGQITGLIAAVPLIYQTDLSVIPDFDTEETYVRGEVHAAGHLMTPHVLMLLFRLISKKKIRVFIGTLRNNN